MKVLIKDHFDYYVMTIDLSEIARIYGHKTKVETSKIINDKTVKTVKWVTDYPTERCRRLFCKIAHAIMWCICEDDPNEISDFLQANNEKAAELWEKVRVKYGI